MPSRKRAPAEKPATLPSSRPPAQPPMAPVGGEDWSTGEWGELIVLKKDGGS